MAEHPILFNTEMVRAILDGRKTQTRRLVKAPDWNIITIPDWANRESLESGVYFWVVGQRAKSGTAIRIKPPCKPGDVLWVRETWCKWWLPHGEWQYCYKATTPYGNRGHVMPDSDDEPFTMPWKPSIHMPREAARLFLRVNGVRIERLQDITHLDVIAEGTPCKLLDKGDSRNPYPNSECLRYPFDELWNSTIKKVDIPRYGWEANPWVWVIEFEREWRRNPWAKT